MKGVYAAFLFVVLCSPLARGGDYFQQRADHLIRASLDDNRHLLHGHITTTYTNNSPDTLDFIYIHLWPNAFSNNQTALANELLEIGDARFYFAPDEQRGYIDSLSFQINNKPAIWGYDGRHVDIAILYPDAPLLPGQTIEWSTPFRLKFPHAGFSRLGHNHQAYHVTQWYPKPAVYDSHGWHPMPYRSFGEFYSEFGNVEVFLTLPENYVVASSGEFMDRRELQWLEELAGITARAGSRNLPDRTEFPESSPRMKTLHLKQENVHDFAWLADKRFYVARSSVNIPGRDMPVDTWAFFYVNASQWLAAPAILNEALLFFSEEIGHYPWPSMSAAMAGNSGGANMEYPAFTIIDAGARGIDLERVLVHEVAHNWFYGILASNERDHPWLDEGFAQFYEQKFFSGKYPDQLLLGDFSRTWLARLLNLDDIPYSHNFHLFYLIQARRHLDQPIGLPAAEYSSFNYAAMVYYKAALGLKYLEAYLGEAAFREAVGQYYRQWAFSHPGPRDVREVFENASGRDLSWFFEDLVLTDGKIDYRLKNLRQPKAPDQSNWSFAIENRGDLAVPFAVSALVNDSVVKTLWYEGFTGRQQLAFPAGPYNSLKLDPGHVMPLLFRQQSSIPRERPLRLQPLFSLEDPSVRQLFVAPVLGWNQYNGLMPGAVFYNSFLPQKPTRWLMMPMYGMRSASLAGTAWVEHIVFPGGIIRELNLGLNLNRYALTGREPGWHFNRLQTSLEASFRKPHPRSSLNRSLGLRFVWIQRNHFDHLTRGTGQMKYYVNELAYRHSQQRVLYPWDASFALQQGRGFARVMAQGNWLLHYPHSLKGVSLRVFAGSFLLKPAHNSPVDYRFRLSAIRGWQDFLLDHIYPGRLEPAGSFWGNQVWEAEGGLKFPTPIGQTWDWLVAVNLKAGLPLLPLKLYLDAGTYQGASSAFLGSRTFPWVLGIQVVPFRNVLEVNFPIVVSSDMGQVAGHTMDKYLQRVTFTLNLQQLNPFRLVNQLGL